MAIEAKTLEQIQDPAAVAGLYDKRYQQSKTGLFSKHNETPLLVAFKNGLAKTDGPLQVVDVGTGPGVHAIDIALNIPRVTVRAMDTSPNAIMRLHDTLSGLSFIGQSRMRFMGSRVVPTQGDILHYLGLHAQNSIQGIHGNSWGHFLPDDVRAEFYEHAFATQTPGGYLAVSQKDFNDALLHQPSTVIIKESKKGIVATPADGITRIFYRDTEAAAQEMQKQGYRIRDAFEWRVGGYDFPQRPDLEASFVGILAQKP